MKSKVIRRDVQTRELRSCLFAYEHTDYSYACRVTSISVTTVSSIYLEIRGIRASCPTYLRMGTRTETFLARNFPYSCTHKRAQIAPLFRKLQRRKNVRSNPFRNSETLLKTRSNPIDRRVYKRICDTRRYTCLLRDVRARRASKIKRSMVGTRFSHLPEVNLFKANPAVHAAIG